jgi:DNA phosphorothioation-dependent restriction protein DptG
MLLLLGVATLGAQSNPPTAPPQFHGTYEELSPAQKELIDEWYAEYNQMTHDHSQPTEYNQFSMSTRTTFEAVTHALMSTELTDKSGKRI